MCFLILSFPVFYWGSSAKRVGRLRELSKRFFILGKKWFDKVNGNTYHSVKIVDLESGETIVRTPRTYGYGEQYVQTAYEELTKLGLVEKVDRWNHELNRERFIIECVDVPRKRDLEVHL